MNDPLKITHEPWKASAFVVKEFTKSGTDVCENMQEFSSILAAINETNKIIMRMMEYEGY